jgi:hypothetical protein
VVIGMGGEDAGGITCPAVVRRAAVLPSTAMTHRPPVVQPAVVAAPVRHTSYVHVNLCPLPSTRLEREVEMSPSQRMSRSAVDRRTLLPVAGAVPVAAVGSAAAANAPPANATATSAAARPDFGVSASAFALGQVRLTASRWLDNQNRTLGYLRFIDADRMLHTFRINVGLASSVQPVGGWEAPGVELRGHTMGHLLSALAQAYANTGDPVYRTKGDYLVNVLAACQATSPSRGYYPGYLSAYPENFFDRLESGQGVWAPWYTLHKIMAGLLDQYQLAGNSQALTVLINKAGWVDWRTGRLSYAQMQSALNNEFGGMKAVLTDLYQQTADARWLTAAQRFDHAAVFDPLAANSDQLNGLHTNTQIAKWIGAAREYKATGTTRYRDIATNAWNFTVNAHSYVIGGNSVREHFKAPNAVAGFLTDDTCESCNTYNMLKLTRELFTLYPGRAELFDYNADSWGNTANGANAPQAPWNGGNNQQWRLNSVGSGRYQVINRGTGTALDGMGRTTAGSTVGMWAANANTNNQWTVTSA